MDVDLLNCKHEIDQRILAMEGQILGEAKLLKRDVEDLRQQVDRLVTRLEFEPVRLITFGMAGGVLIAALGAVMARVLGW